MSENHDKYEFMSRMDLLNECRRLQKENLKLGELVKLSEQMLEEQDDKKEKENKKKRRYEKQCLVFLME